MLNLKPSEVIEYLESSNFTNFSDEELDRLRNVMDIANSKIAHIKITRTKSKLINKKK